MASSATVSASPDLAFATNTYCGDHCLRKLRDSAERCDAANDALRLDDHRHQNEFEIVLGESATDTQKLIALAASSRSPVLITGETGVGKNLVARVIHERGPWRSSRFLAINCAALPEQLVEAELFGYEKGAFTGAVAAKKGLFELAEGGTLLLDELGEMPLHIQTKLLGILDDGHVRRLGSESVRRVSTRIIVATNVNLEESLGKTFRRDLYYRLSVIPIAVPPLRQRLDDMANLCRHLLKTMNGGVAVDISTNEVAKLQGHAWPGNVRELRNVLERALVVFRGSELRPSELLAASHKRKDAGTLV